MGHTRLFLKGRATLPQHFISFHGNDRPVGSGASDGGSGSGGSDSGSGSGSDGSGDGDGGSNNDGSGRMYPADWATKTKRQKRKYWKRRQSGKGQPGP